MSSFTGKFKEYPLISADNFEKENLSSVAFFLSHCHKDHMSGLDSSAFYQRLCGSKSVFLYCSETSENLLMCNASYSHLKKYIRSIPLEQQTLIPLVDEQNEEQSSICVTLLPAGHCVGSVMFLFEGQHGNILYTGDFRLSKGDVKRVPFFHANGRIKDIKSIYIDTTFCLPKMSSLPSREQSRDAILELMDRWLPRGSEYVVSLLCKGMYGFEYLLKEVAMKYKTKIHVSRERMAMYKYLPDMTSYFTTDGQFTRIHACKWESERQRESDLPCGLSIHPSRKVKVLRIKPTTMWVARDTEPMPADYKRYDKGKRLWRVVHSMHASMEEIQDLVGYLRPYHVFPNVPPAGLDTLEDAFERLKGLTRLQECDSCNQDESGEERFKENAARYCTTEEEKPKLKAMPTGLLPLTRPAPDEKVLAQCKELGIEEEESLAPIPKRRKAKPSNVVCAEKIAEFIDLTTFDGQADLARKPVEQLREFCGRTSNNSRRTVPLSKDELRIRYEDREERQFDPTTAATSGDEVRALDDSKVLSKDSNEQMNDTAQSKTIKLDGECFQSRKDGEKDVRRPRSDFLDNKGNAFFDKNIAQSKTKDDDATCSWDNSGRIANNFIAKTKCVTSSGKPTGLEFEGWVGGELHSGLDFNVPPSPGHVEPRPEKLSSFHQSMENGELISVTKIS